MVNTPRSTPALKNITQLFTREALKNSTVRNIFIAFLFSSIIYYYLDGLVTEIHEKTILFRLQLKDSNVYASLQDQEHPIKVTLKGPKDLFNRVEFQPLLYPITLEDLDGHPQKNHLISLPPLLKIPSSFQILDVQPENLSIELARIQSKMVDVEIAFETKNLPASYQIGEAYCIPGEVELVGPASDLQEIVRVKTQKLVLDQNLYTGWHSYLSAVLVPPSIQSNKVEVRFRVFEETSLKFDVDIFCLTGFPNLQSQIKRIEPIEVEFKGASQSLLSINWKLKGYIDLTDIDEEEEKRIIADGTAIKRKVHFLDLPKDITPKKDNYQVNVEFINKK
jgi:YbbR domain-containing protein